MTKKYVEKWAMEKRKPAKVYFKDGYWWIRVWSAHNGANVLIPLTRQALISIRSKIEKLYWEDLPKIEKEYVKKYLKNYLKI